MSIHEHLPPQREKQLKEVGWTKGLEFGPNRQGGTGSTSIVQPGCTKRLKCRRRIKQEVEKELTGKENRTGRYLFQTIPEPDAVIDRAIEPRL